MSGLLDLPSFGFIDIAPLDLSTADPFALIDDWSDAEEIDLEVEQFSKSFAELDYWVPQSMNQCPPPLARPVSVTSSIQSSDVSTHSDHSASVSSHESLVTEKASLLPAKKRRWLADPDTDSDYGEVEDKDYIDDMAQQLLKTRAVAPPPKKKTKRAPVKTEPPKQRNTTTKKSTDPNSNGHDANWSKNYNMLQEYYHRHGHSNVPNYCQEYPVLARWVKRQRFQYRAQHKGKCHSMTPERIAAMERLDFVWDTQAVAWATRLADLKEFVKRHGHASVPTRYHNHALAVWVKSQRRQYKLYRQGQHSTLTDERVAQLETLKFEWNLRPYKTLGPYNKKKKESFEEQQDDGCMEKIEL